MARFLVDQQLPHPLAHHLTDLGHDAQHIKEYPDGPTMPDHTVAEIADREGRAVVTKDKDFRVSHLLENRPARLVHVTCGNIATRDLLHLVERHREDIALAAKRFDYFEITRLGVVVHDPT